MKRAPRIEVFEGLVGWHVRIRAANGRILLSSEGYKTESNAKRAARSLSKAIGLKVKIVPVK